jgi:hypothetical protein
VTSTTGCQPSGDTQTRACLHFSQVNTSPITLAQDFIYRQPGMYFYYPAIQIDSNNSLVAVFNQSSTTEYPSIYASGQPAGAAPGTFSAPVPVFEERFPLTPSSPSFNRWGDYSGAGLDSSGTFVWVAAEYVHSASSDDWGTWISPVQLVGAQAFLTGYALNTPPLRNNFSGFVGMQFTVGPDALSVSALGRIFITGNSGTHTVKLVQADGTDVPGGSVSVSMTGGVADQFKYVSLGSPVSLLANTAYYLVSQEASGGDQWYDTGTVSSTNAGAVNTSIYSFNNSVNWNSYNTANTSYVPANFQYH